MASGAVAGGILAAHLSAPPAPGAGTRPESFSRSQPQVETPVAAPAGVAALASRALRAQVSELSEENQQLATELAEVAEELATRKSEVSFSYGSAQESGAFVGRTLRLRQELADSPELQAIESETFENQLDVLSLGPFIREADVLESDPLIFAQFQSALIGEMLQVDAGRRVAISGILQQRKAESLAVEDDDEALLELNDQAAAEVFALLTEGERAARAKQLTFLREHGMLMIPAYAVLE